MEVKKEIIERYERGGRVAEIARFYKKSMSAPRLQRRRRKRQKNPSLQMRLGRCVKCGKQCKILLKAPLNKAVAVRAINLFNDNAMSHFHGILKRRQKQVLLHRFPVKDSIEPVDSSDSVSDSESHPTQ